MRLSTLDYLRTVDSYYPPELISPACGAWIAKIAEVLPPSSNFGFECKLADPEPSSDFLIAVIPSDGSRAAWAGENTLARGAPRASASAAWRAVRSFNADWHSDPALSPVHDTWLEFDRGGPDDALPEPSFFFGFDSSVADNYPDLALDLVERLRQRPLEGEHRSLLLRCFAALPPNGIIFQVGIMLARATDEIRLCTRRLKRSEIVPYLDTLGWPGSADELERLLDEIAPYVDGVNLDLSISDSVSPAVGLETVIGDGRDGRAKARGYFDFLIARESCLPDKAKGVFDWLGYSTEVSDRERWPGHLLRASAEMGDSLTSTFARTLNHIKLTLAPGKPIGAKAYLGVRHFWARKTEDVA